MFTTLLKPFDEMTDEDYLEIGLKSGLEIHQQLLTEKKLFCRCPAGNYNHEYDAEILRHMRPTLSELGEYDGTALMEFKTKKEIIYQINHNTVCTYEMDDTPPFEINNEALNISILIAMLMNYKLVGEIHIARKQYLDGSIPTGFQRTTIVGIDGWIPYKDRKIGLIQLGLEEDSCREVSDIEHRRVYRADRLGMPLIETVTEPVLHTPREVAEVANILRWLVRSTGKVRTGIGATRQDVNVSIKGGTRIEIKGVPRIKLIPHLIYNEALRQYSLLKIKDELSERGIDQKTFKYKSADVSKLLTKSSWGPINQALIDGNSVHCVNLKGYMGILSFPTQTGKVFSKEISDRVRVIACLTHLPNILTSESTEETIGSYTWGRIRKLVDANSRDAQILVWGSEKDIQTAINEIVIRAREAIDGVPSETRQALADGTNGFERILPGPERMYPDTDLPPISIDEDLLTKISKNLPIPIWEREVKYKELGIPEFMRTKIASSEHADFFEHIVEKYKISPMWIVRYLFQRLTYWGRIKLDTTKLDEKFWDYFFEKCSNNNALLEIGEMIIENYLRNEDYNFNDNLNKVMKKKVEQENVKKSIIENIKSSPPPSYSTNKKEYYMGCVMHSLRGKIKGSSINKELNALLNEGIEL